MDTVGMERALADRMMRRAISPRLAMRSLGGLSEAMPSCCGDRCIMNGR